MQTPTKKVKRGRKPASECSGDFCQLRGAFKVKFGDIDDIKVLRRNNYNTDSCILVRLPLKLLLLKKIYSKYQTLSRTCCMTARTSFLNIKFSTAISCSFFKMISRSECLKVFNFFGFLFTHTLTTAPVRSLFMSVK